jgi:hypothetical protein
MGISSLAVFMLSIIVAINKNNPIKPPTNKRNLFNLPKFLDELINETLLLAKEAVAKLKNGKD